MKKYVKVPLANIKETKRQLKHYSDNTNDWANFEQTFDDLITPGSIKRTNAWVKKERQYRRGMQP